MPRAALRLIALAAALSAAPRAAPAHDTWLEPATPGQPGSLHLRLGTGAQFPRMENSPGTVPLESLGCRGHGAPAGARPTALRRGRDDGLALALTARWAAPGTAAAPVTCWAQLAPLDIELKPELIEVYFREIAAPPAVREAWAALQARGQPFVERYTKHARWDRFAAGSGVAPPKVASPQPAPLGLDILIDPSAGPPRRGRRLVFTVLRDGQPLPGLAIEARSALSPLGLWLRTDAQGRAETTLPLAGRWLLRGTDLRLSDARPDTWESRFVTLAFDAAP